MNSVSWNIELKCYNELQQMLQIMIYDKMPFQVISCFESEHTEPTDKHSPFVLPLHVFSYSLNFS